MPVSLAFHYRALRYRYRVDPQEIRFLQQHLQPGDGVVDVGCHKGAYLYWMRKAVGKNGRVWGFEPQRRLYEYLQREVGAQPNVVIEHLGVSDRAGELSLQVPPSRRGTSPGASFSAPHEAVGHRETVGVVRLDEYFAATSHPLRLLKIDVEGHELPLLRGAEQLLEQQRPTLLMECENRHLTEGNVFDVFAFLTQRGYRGQFFSGKGLCPLEDFDPAAHQRREGERFWEAPGYVNNFVFLG